MAQIAVFKSPSKIQFDVKPKAVKRPLLSETKRGETFLWQGANKRVDPAVCMRADVSAHQVLTNYDPSSCKGIERSMSDAIWITNLQTGRTFVAVDCEIEYIKVKMTVEGL